MSDEQQPVAWAVVLNAIEAISMNGGATYRVTASKDEAERIAAHAMAVVPLYERQPPALTDAEREAVELVCDWLGPMVIDDQAVVATLRGLLERQGHDRR